MKCTAYNWPFKWFGFWNEYGDNYLSCPSITDFIDEQVNNRYEKEQLIAYLKNGIVLVASSRAAFPSPIDREIGFGSVSIRTDGKWLWLDTICNLIEQHSVIVPEAFYADVVSNQFIIPEVSDQQMEQLNWPEFK